MPGLPQRELNSQESIELSKKEWGSYIWVQLTELVTLLQKDTYSPPPPEVNKEVK